MDEEKREGEDRIITLTDDEGNELDFELLSFVDYQEKTYAIFTPYVEDEEEPDPDSDMEVVIMEPLMDGEEITFQMVDDQILGNQILNAFTEMCDNFETEES